MDHRGSRVLRFVRLGPGNGGASVEENITLRQRGTERGSIGVGVRRMLSFRLCVVFFLVLATFMWLPPALHAGVTAAITLLVLIVPIAHRWFTHRAR